MFLRINKFGYDVPYMNSKKIDEQCEQLYNVLIDYNLCFKSFKEIEKIINNALDKTRLLKRQAHTLRAFTEEINPDSFNKRTSGKIKYYNTDRGFGFIDISMPQDVFFHIKDYKKNIDNEPIIAYSGRNLPPIPEHACHLFRGKVATHSG
jgi:hypothetical protein